MVYLCNCVKNSKRRKMWKMEIEKNEKNRRKSKFIDVFVCIEFELETFCGIFRSLNK